MAQDDPSSIMSDALAELAGLLLGAESFDDLAEQIAQLAARTVPAAATCAITLSVADRALTVATADPLGRLLDEQQYDIDEGPCLEAIRTRVIVTAGDLATDTRWDGYPARALAHGIASVSPRRSSSASSASERSTSTPAPRTRSLPRTWRPSPRSRASPPPVSPAPCAARRT